jgi:hypothetical protein
MMPAFSPLAGFSPSCWAGLVQMEHWAFTACAANNKVNKMKNNMVKNFFIFRKYKITTCRNEVFQNYFLSRY